MHFFVLLLFEFTYCYLATGLFEKNQNQLEIDKYIYITFKLSFWHWSNNIGSGERSIAFFPRDGFDGRTS